MREHLLAPTPEERNVLLRRVLIGAAAGYGANRAMDVATAWFYASKDLASKVREE